MDLRLILMVGAVAGGCGGPEPTPPAAPAPAAVETASLPELGDPIPLLDGGRIEAAPPQGWHIPARSSKFLARFQHRADSIYPTILLTADDYDFSDVTTENVSELAARVAAEESLATVKPVRIGRFVGVTYRKRGVEKESVTRILERFFLATVAGGRKYTLELRTGEDSLAEAQPYLLAVAAGIRFPKAQSPPPAAKEPAAAGDEAEPAGEDEKQAEPAPKPKADALDIEGLNLDELLKQ